MKVYTILPDALYQRGKMHHIGLAEKRAALRHLGVGVVVGLAPSRADNGLAELDKAGEVMYYHHPIPDGAVRNGGAAELRLAADVARLAYDRQVAVLSHCNAGRNRSGLFCALILRHWAGMSGLEAIAHVRAARPRALANQAFVEFLSGLPPLQPTLRKPVAGQLALL